MQLPKIFFATLLSFSLNAQDSLTRPSLKLFDVNIRLGTYSCFYHVYNTLDASRFTKHKEFMNESFTKGYSDTISLHRAYFLENIVIPVEIGIGTVFKFQNAKSSFLKRRRPYAGFHYSSQSLFHYKLGHETKTKVNSLTFIDPAYQAERIDSVTFGEINYSAASKLIFLEAGTYYDIAIRRRLKLYSGFILGFGCGFDNTFTVSRYKKYYIAKKMVIQAQQNSQ